MYVDASLQQWPQAFHTIPTPIAPKHTEQKSCVRHRSISCLDQVLLTRVGEFYETYGVDAVMMMQHAGLNKMGQEIRAGCPRKNVQQTLDGLTGAGLTVAVYEEVMLLIQAQCVSREIQVCEDRYRMWVAE